MERKIGQQHQQWLEEHLHKRTGERKRCLRQGHAHAEIEMIQKVWWPAFGHFRFLHPEYEVRDFLDGRRFLDFAYIRPPIRIAIEVDGYGPHLANASRRQFCDERIRQAHLANDGWIVIRIGYDDLTERPRVWQQLLQQLIGRLFGSSESSVPPYSQVRELVKLAVRLDRPIKLADIQEFFRIGYRASSQIMNVQVKGGLFIPVGGGPARAHAWKLNEAHPHLPGMMG